MHVQCVSEAQQERWAGLGVSSGTEMIQLHMYVEHVPSICSIPKWQAYIYGSFLSFTLQFQDTL